MLFDLLYLFVIDEYPYLAKTKPAISAMLQHAIDHKWTESRMYLILCGSSMSFMENQVLGQESPLYGRRTGQFKDPMKKKQVQIDIVGTPVEGRDYIIGSCKYKNEKIGVDELNLIRDYASVFGKGKNYYYHIFSKSGFTDGLLQAQERGEVRLRTLDDLY